MSVAFFRAIVVLPLRSQYHGCAIVQIFPDCPLFKAFLAVWECPMPCSWFEEQPIQATAVVLVVGILLRELITHLKDILVVFFGGLKVCVSVFWVGAISFSSALVAGIGATAASTVILTSIAIPITTVSIYVLFRTAKEKPKAWIVAVGLFLNPLFIDFFKDQLQGSAIEKLLISSTGVATFLVATALWNKEPSDQGNGGGWRGWTRTTAILLFILPTFCMLGLVVKYAHDNSRDVMGQLRTPTTIFGLV